MLVHEVLKYLAHEIFVHPTFKLPIHRVVLGWSVPGWVGIGGLAAKLLVVISPPLVFAGGMAVGPPLAGGA